MTPSSGHKLIHQESCGVKASEPCTCEAIRNPFSEPQDPEQEYELHLLVTLRGYGTRRQQESSAERVLKEIQVTSHDPTITCYFLRQINLEGKTGPWYKRLQRVIRTDRNAPDNQEAPE